MGGLLDRDGVCRVLLDAMELLPDAEVIERDDWVQVRTPSSTLPNHNRVLRARLPAGEVEDRIADVLAEHRARGAGLGWIVDGTSSPTDLSSRLVAAGVGKLGDGRGMTRPAPTDPPPALPANVRIEPATREDAARLGELGTRAWRDTPGFRRSITEWVERVFDRRDDAVEVTLAFLDDELVGSAILHVVAGVGYMQGSCVLPAVRGQGIYNALTLARLERLRQRGVPHAVIWADPTTSGPVADRLGFIEVTTAVFHEVPSPTG